MQDEEKLTPEEELEDLLYELFELDFDELDAVQEIETDVLQILQQNPNHICVLIVLMFIEIMRGNRYKAQSFGNKIWEIGGQLPPFFEMMYLENLLNLGLVDMAMILLKPRFEQLSANISDFYSVLLKFSVMTGNTGLLRRIEAFTSDDDSDDPLFSFADSLNSAGKGEVFKNIQKIILESMHEKFCAYEYWLDDETPNILGITLYINNDEQHCLALQQQTNQKIKAYLLSIKETIPTPVEFSVRNIQEHEAWLPQE